MRTLLFYSDKHINVNITPVQNSMPFILRKEELFSIISKQRKFANFDVFLNYFPSLIAA